MNIKAFSKSSAQFFNLSKASPFYQFAYHLQCPKISSSYQILPWLQGAT